MGEFAGVFGRNGAGIDPRIVDRLSASLFGVVKPRVWRGESFAMVHRPLRQREVAGSAFLPCELRTGAVIAADCRLDEPSEIADALGLAVGSRIADEALVAAACERWGAGAAERLNGSFAFALWDARDRRLALARDALGTRTLFYVELPGQVLFATALQSLLALPET
ncbi:MAG TPA: hypothetical protein VI251_03065, partial [Pseudolabrys sp.]